MELGGQDAQDLDRVIRIMFQCRLCRHLSILHQRADIVAEVGPSWSHVSRPLDDQAVALAADAGFFGFGLPPPTAGTSMILKTSQLYDLKVFMLKDGGAVAAVREGAASQLITCYTASPGGSTCDRSPPP